MGFMSGLLAEILICLTLYDSITLQAALQVWLGSPSTFTKHLWKLIFNKICKKFPIHAFILMICSSTTFIRDGDYKVCYSSSTPYFCSFSSTVFLESFTWFSPSSSMWTSRLIFWIKFVLKTSTIKVQVYFIGPHR